MSTTASLILAIASHNTTTTPCSFIYARSEAFPWNGWFNYSDGDTKFGSPYWSSLVHPESVQLLIYQNQWHFYNWNDKGASYALSITNGQEDIPTIQDLSSQSHTTWDYLEDGSQITISLTCSNHLDPHIGPIYQTPISTTLDARTEDIDWLIDGQSCFSQNRGYAAFMIGSLSITTAYWPTPRLSNHSSNITVAVSGEAHTYKSGHHTVTYAAEVGDHFIMCQIKLYVFGMMPMIVMIHSEIIS